MYLIKSDHDQVFGAYTSLSISSPDKELYRDDKDAFIFSLTKKTKHEQIQGFLQKKEDSVGFSKKIVTGFGRYGDLLIREGSEITGFRCYSELGRTYALPEDVEDGSSYLAGNENFSIKEFAVF